jgi:hypothetical protein
MKALSGLFVLASLGGLTVLAAVTGDDAVATTYKAFVQANEKGDMAVVKTLLDEDFTWIDTHGVFIRGKTPSRSD